jgi:hypothetical protein
MKKKDDLIESLLKLGAKKEGDNFRFLKPNLVIKCKETGLKYTISSVRVRMGPEGTNEDYEVSAYRFSPGTERKTRILIKKEDFDKYEIA